MSAAALLLAAAAAQAEPATAFVESRFHVYRGAGVLALRDVDGDGDLDVLRLEAAGVSLRRMDADGGFPAEDEPRLAWPSDHLAWDLADLDGDGATELLCFVGGRELVSYAARPEGGFDEGRLVLEAQGYLPHGISRLELARDVDGDGALDLVLPGPGEYRVVLRRGGGWAPPLRVRFEADTEYRFGDPARLDARFGQRVSVPWFQLDDIDGDGTMDLVSETGDRVYVHLARPELSDEPSWVLDLAALRDELPQGGSLDFDDLLSMVRRVAWRIADVDGRAPRDLVLQVGSTLKVYRGGARDGPSGTPQILKLSGNLLWFFLRDVEGDALPELQLLRGDEISLGRVLRWLILPGALDFDLYTYENRGGLFGKSPARRGRVRLEIPRLLPFIEQAEEFGARIEARHSIPARRADLDGDGRADDVVDLVGGELRVHRGAAPPRTGPDLEGLLDLEQILETLVLRDLDRLGDGGTRTIDLADVESWSFSPGAELRAACAGREADWRMDFVAQDASASVHVADLDGDGRDDLVLVGRPEDHAFDVRLLVQRR